MAKLSARTVRIMRIIVLAISAVNAVCALVCGILFITAPNGSLMHMQTLTSLLSNFPLRDVFFKNFLWIGIAMLLMLGVPNSVAVLLTFHKRRPRYGFQVNAGAFLLAWCLIEIIWLPNPAVWCYFVVALAHIALALLLTRVAHTGARQPHV